MVYDENDIELSWVIESGANSDGNQIGQLYDWSYNMSSSKMKLSCHDRSNRVRYVTKIRQDNDMIDRNGAVYAKNEIELSSSIRPTIVCDENQIGQWCDRSYKYGLRQKQN